MKRKLVPHHSHWGAFNAVVEDGKVVGAVPFDFDPDPSPLIDAIPDSVHSPLRIARPMIRAGWLKDARAGGEGRGREPFVPVDWEQALEVVAGELAPCGANMALRRLWAARKGGHRPVIFTRRAGNCGGFSRPQAGLSTRPATTASGRR